MLSGTFEPRKEAGLCLYVYRPEVSRLPWVSRRIDKLLVGTVNGIFPFVKSNGGWSRQETMLPDQHISAIIFEPSSQMLFAGSL